MLNYRIPIQKATLQQEVDHIKEQEKAAQQAREHAAMQVDASDETRLAAGWVQDWDVVQITMPWPPDHVADHLEPAPGVAGKRRLQGNLLVRWVRPKKEA